MGALGLLGADVLHQLLVALLRGGDADRRAARAADLPADPAERLDTLISRVAEFQLGDEAVRRALVRAGLERWFSQYEHQHQHGRARARTRRADTLPPRLHRRLTTSVTLVYGVEALIATRDSGGLDPEEARDVMRWAASALLEKAVRETPDA